MALGWYQLLASAAVVGRLAGGEGAVAALVAYDGSRVECEYARDAWERWERGCGLITSRMCVSECGSVAHQ